MQIILRSPFFNCYCLWFLHNYECNRFLLISIFDTILLIMKIIIARHSEKLDAPSLSEIGKLRAQALAAQYLGQNAKQSLFIGKERPAALMVMTLHTIETMAPIAASWNMPMLAYWAEAGIDRAHMAVQNVRNQAVAKDLLFSAQYEDKTVLMIWEHFHIASAALEAEFAGEKVTLRQLLNLDQMVGVPTTWPDDVYDYFWIIEYQTGNPVPQSFLMKRQIFTAPFAGLPAADWPN